MNFYRRIARIACVCWVSTASSESECASYKTHNWNIICILENSFEFSLESLIDCDSIDPEKNDSAPWSALRFLGHILRIVWCRNAGWGYWKITVWSSFLYSEWFVKISVHGRAKMLNTNRQESESIFHIRQSADDCFHTRFGFVGHYNVRFLAGVKEISIVVLCDK